MQDSISYKITQTINNWFADDYQNLDYDETAIRSIIPDTIYCASCATRKSIHLITFTYDVRNRKVSKCKQCVNKITKGVK